ncbi:MAG: acyltransferase family protein, partial [Hyphomicrobium sp.]
LAAPVFAMPKLAAEVLSAAGGAAILASFAVLSPEAHFPGLGALPACLGTAAIIATGLHQPTLVSRALAWKPAVFVGLISYSLYLWHWPLISLVSYQLERQMSVVEAVAVAAASFAVAVLSWRYVERPFRARHGAHAGAAGGFSASDIWFVRVTLAGIVCVMGIAGVLKAGKGLPQRFDANVRTVLEQMVTGNPLRGQCDDYQNIFKNDNDCNFGRRKQASESYDVALFGDSMADHWGPLVASFASDKNLSGRQVTNGGCGLLFGVKIPAWPLAKSRECSFYQKEAEKFITANPGLKLAVVSGFWEKWLGRIEHPEQKLDVPVAMSAVERSGASAARFDKVLRDTIEVFTQRGIKVLLIGQIPTYVTLPVRCIVGAMRTSGDAAACGMTQAAAEAQLTRSDAALLRAASANPGVSVSLPSQFMCQKAYCSPL